MPGAQQREKEKRSSELRRLTTYTDHPRDGLTLHFLQNSFPSLERAIAAYTAVVLSSLVYNRCNPEQEHSDPLIYKTCVSSVAYII